MDGDTWPSQPKAMAEPLVTRLYLTKPLPKYRQPPRQPRAALERATPTPTPQTATFARSPVRGQALEVPLASGSLYSRGLSDGGAPTTRVPAWNHRREPDRGSAPRGPPSTPPSFQPPKTPLSGRAGAQRPPQPPRTFRTAPRRRRRAGRHHPPQPRPRVGGAGDTDLKEQPRRGRRGAERGRGRSITRGPATTKLRSGRAGGWGGSPRC